MSSQEHSTSVAKRVVSVCAIVAGGALGATAVTGAVLAVIFARTVVTPPRKRKENLRVLSHDETTITLAPSIDSMTSGFYSMWFAGDSGHARIGEILTYSSFEVTRQLLGVDRGSLDGVTRARIGGWFYLRPEDLGYEFIDIDIETDLGPAPAWLIPSVTPSVRWVIGVHGRAVRREEALRAVPVFRDAGYTSLLVSYRNDGDAPASADHRYSLGDTEWSDVDAALRYAIDNGAQQVILMGWSMGGATVLQVVTRSPLAGSVTGVVLESPVVDWFTALHFQGMAHRLPRPVRLAMFSLLSQKWARVLTGQADPIDFGRLDLVSRAQELGLPVLVLHSVDDGYVPVTASRALAAARPDIVTFEEFDTARHTRLWNYDPVRWSTAIRLWLESLPGPGLRRTSRESGV
ncbi:MAG: alpha/beta fold hydrolase [Salinibacterium sp.]|nr:alpha/beta fold hydrolase [Salinibacterium sp.]